MIDLNTLAKVSNEVACEKGWWDGPPRSVAALTLLMQSENAEALEDYRANKPLTEVWYEVKYERDSAEGVFDGSNKRSMSKTELDQLQTLPNVTIKEAKPCGIPIEIADTLIRIADFAANRNLDLNEAHRKLAPGRGSLGFEEALAESNFWISMVWKNGTLPEYLVKACDCLLLMCEHQKIDIEAAIEEKTTFNRTRPVRHGGKKI